LEGPILDPTFDALLRSWPADPLLLLSLLLLAAVYVAGWRTYRQLGSRRFGTFQLYAFLAGLAAVYLALASPIEPMTNLLLVAHMLQHLILMMVAPPLLLLGAPVLPLLRGLPLPIRRHWMAPLFRARLSRSLFSFLSHPVTAWTLFSVSIWVWHIPILYERTLLSPRWHYAEHIFFFGTALLFWWPVIQPYPSRARWPRWTMIPYLLLADVQNTLLSAIFCFSDQVLYEHYARSPRLWSLSALEDQRAAGVLMWIPGSMAYLFPVAVLGWKVLYGGGSGKRKRQQPLPRRQTSLPILNPQVGYSPRAEQQDLLDLPGIGPILRWRHTRAIVQAALLLFAIVVVVDGFSGPPAAPMNLAGVLPWIHWRGLVVFGLLVLGNLFCYACPFTLPRRLAGAWFSRGQAVPSWLRTKWIAVGLLLVFFWAYEVFAIWNDPAVTALLIVGYFLASFAVDSWFRAGTFCKYVCPIGQFHFAQSLLSPFEVSVREPAVCQSCVTKDCIRGNDRQRGCEMLLFQPQKIGNLDCTFCLDCVHACPQQNVGILPVIPGSTLSETGWRSGIGWLTQRMDLQVMLVLLVFAGFANAAGMIEPVATFFLRQTRYYELASPVLPMTLAFGLFVVILPGLWIPAATVWTARIGRFATGREVATRQILALVPLGASMWLVHFGFHFLTSYGTWLPVSQRVLVDAGWTSVVPDWTCGCCSVIPGWITKLEIVALQIGWLGSLYLGYRAARDLAAEPRQGLACFLPWCLLASLLFLLGLWIIFQPMEMRGTVLAI
jgi:cytochrome c oxidase assembly factor CtaG